MDTPTQISKSASEASALAYESARIILSKIAPEKYWLSSAQDGVATLVQSAICTERQKDAETIALLTKKNAAMKKHIVKLKYDITLLTWNV